MHPSSSAALPTPPRADSALKMQLGEGPAPAVPVSSLYSVPPGGSQWGEVRGGSCRHLPSCTHLLLCKVVLTQLLPQLPVLTEHRQCGRHLAQGDDVPSVGESVQDVVECMQGQVTEGQASVHLLQRTQDSGSQ